MQPAHVFAGLLVVAIWGLNFVAIKIALVELPPIFLAALRFAIAAFPAMAFIKPPKTPLRDLVLYGLANFAAAFGFLFLGMRWGVSAGLASLLMQLQVFFTIGFARFFLKERIYSYQIFGAALAFAGLAVIAVNIGANGVEGGPIAILMVVLGAASWGWGNILSKRMGTIDRLGLTTWGCVVATAPLAALSLGLEGARRDFDALTHLSVLGMICVLYIAWPNTLLAFSIWNRLLVLYPAALVAPLTLLVPIMGMGSSALLLGEPLQNWKIFAGILVCAGLVVNIFGARLKFPPFKMDRR